MTPLAPSPRLDPTFTPKLPTTSSRSLSLHPRGCCRSPRWPSPLSRGACWSSLRGAHRGWILCCQSRPAGASWLPSWRPSLLVLIYGITSLHLVSERYFPSRFHPVLFFLYHAVNPFPGCERPHKLARLPIGTIPYKE